MQISSTTRAKANFIERHLNQKAGTKKVGLLAWFKGKPELSADSFEGLSAHQMNNFKVKKFKLPSPDGSKPITPTDVIYKINRLARD